MTEEQHGFLKNPLGKLAVFVVFALAYAGIFQRDTVLGTAQPDNKADKTGKVSPVPDAANKVKNPLLEMAKDTTLKAMRNRTAQAARKGTLPPPASKAPALVK